MKIKMKYIMVYRDTPSGYNWSVRNSDGLYAAATNGDGSVYMLTWRTVKEASNYVYLWAGADLIWAPWPGNTDSLPLKRVASAVTAREYKSAHGGFAGTVTARYSSSASHIKEVARLENDGNEEPTTVPHYLVHQMDEPKTLGGPLRRASTLILDDYPY